MQDTSVIVTKGSASQNRHALVKTKLSQRFVKFLFILVVFVAIGFILRGNCCCMCFTAQTNLKRM